MIPPRTAPRTGRAPSSARILALAGLLLVSVAPAVWAAERPCVPAASGERFAVDFQDVELGAVARLVSCAAQLDLLFTPSTLASARITVIAPKPVALDGLVSLFRIAATRAGLVVERHGAYHVIRKAEGGAAPARPAQPPSKRRSTRGR